MINAYTYNHRYIKRILYYMGSHSVTCNPEKMTFPPIMHYSQYDIISFWYTHQLPSVFWGVRRYLASSPRYILSFQFARAHTDTFTTVVRSPTGCGEKKCRVDGQESWLQGWT